MQIEEAPLFEDLLDNATQVWSDMETLQSKASNSSGGIWIYLCITDYFKIEDPQAK